MSYLPNVEKIESGPEWMDSTAYTEEQKLMDAAYMARQEEIALADLYSAPAMNAIRAIPNKKFSKEALKNILICLASKVTQSDWMDTEAGETSFGSLNDFANDLEVM